MLNCGDRISRDQRGNALDSRNEGRAGSAAYRLGEVVEVDGGEAEEVLAAEPPDRRHACPPPRPSLGSTLWRRRNGVLVARRGGAGLGAAAALYPEFRIRVSSLFRLFPSLVGLEPRLVEASRG